MNWYDIHLPMTRSIGSLRVLVRRAVFIMALLLA